MKIFDCMKHIIKASVTAAAIISLSACEKEIKFTGRQQETSIVMFSLASPGDELSVSIRQSAFILDKEWWETIEKGIPGAKVNAFIGNSTEPLPFTLSGNDRNSALFTCGYQPKPGEKIRIEAEADGFKNVYAETEIPLEPVFGVESIRTEKGETDSEAVVYMKIRIDDPDGKKNFYRLDISQTYRHEGTIWTSDGKISTQEILYGSSPVAFYSNDPLFQDGITDSIFGIEVETELKNYFTDSRFDGDSYSFEIYFPVYDDDYMKTVSIDIKLEALSKEYYEYIASLDAYYESDDFSLFSEPVQVICNVKNGIGCCGASTPSEISVTLE